MGLRDSPYRSLQLMIKAKYLAYGHRNDKSNPFHWDHITLNLPGAPDYNPTLPWVMKVRFDDHLACEIYIYVDDGRITGWCKLACWRATRRFCSVLCFLGIQDASRKRTEPVPDPGPWAGTVVHTMGGVNATVTEAKWEKTRALILELQELLHHPLLPLLGGPATP